MKNVLIIPGRLPNLNDYTNACRSNAQAGGSMKKKEQKRIEYKSVQT